MRRPATYFAKVQNRLTSLYLPNTLNYIQYRLLCITQATYRAIKVIDFNLFKTVTNYVAGRLISTSLGLFQDSAITFIARYVAWVTHNSLYYT